VTYLIVGLDRKTHVAWHENVSAGDTGTAKRIAQARAKAKGIDLVVAAVIGPNSAVVLAPAEGRTLESKAA
jgi:glycerate-2-kinase